MPTPDFLSEPHTYSKIKIKNQIRATNEADTQS